MFNCEYCNEQFDNNKNGVCEIRNDIHCCILCCHYTQNTCLRCNKNMCECCYNRAGLCFVCHIEIECEICNEIDYYYACKKCNKKCCCCCIEINDNSLYGICENCKN